MGVWTLFPVALRLLPFKAQSLLWLCADMYMLWLHYTFFNTEDGPHKILLWICPYQPWNALSVSWKTDMCVAPRKNEGLFVKVFFLSIVQFCLSNQVLYLLKPTGVVPIQVVEAFVHLYFFQEILWVLEDVIYKNTACILEPTSFSSMLNSWKEKHIEASNSVQGGIFIDMYCF